MYIECNKLLTFTKQLMQNNRGYNPQLNTCNSIQRLLISRVLAFKDAIKPDTDANIMNPAAVTSKTAAARTERETIKMMYIHFTSLLLKHQTFTIYLFSLVLVGDGRLNTPSSSNIGKRTGVVST